MIFTLVTKLISMVIIEVEMKDMIAFMIIKEE